MIVSKYLDDQKPGSRIASTLKRKGIKATPSKQRNLTPRQTLTIFTQAVREDDLALHFDLLTFNNRCLDLLRRIQNACLEAASVYQCAAGDYHLGTAIGLLLHFHAVATDANDEKVGFKEACRLLQEDIEAEGSAQLSKARSRAGIVQKPDAHKYVAPKSFEDLHMPEDYLSLRDRKKFEDGFWFVGNDAFVQSSDGTIKCVRADVEPLVVHLDDGGRSCVPGVPGVRAG